MSGVNKYWRAVWARARLIPPGVGRTRLVGDKPKNERKMSGNWFYDLSRVDNGQDEVLTLWVFPKISLHWEIWQWGENYWPWA